MPIAYMPVRDASPSYTVFGKLPRRADFVRIDAGYAVTREFDELLAKSLALAHRQPDWNEAVCLSAGPSEFLFTSSDGRECFTGVIHPSRDEAGRVYPLVAGVILPARAVVPQAAELSIANELFFSGLCEQLESAVGNAVDLLACRQFLETWAAPNPHVEDDLGLAAQILAGHMNRTPAEQWHSVLMDAGQDGLDDRLLAFTFHALAPYSASPPTLLPLSKMDGEDTLDQAAWLALCRTAANNGACPDFVAMTRQGQRYLALSPGRMNGRFLVPLWGVTPEASEDVDNPSWRRHPAHAEVAYALARQLQDPAVTLSSLQEALERIARTLADKTARDNPFSFSFTH